MSASIVIDSPVDAQITGFRAGLRLARSGYSTLKRHAFEELLLTTLNLSTPGKKYPFYVSFVWGYLPVNLKSQFSRRTAESLSHFSFFLLHSSQPHPLFFFLPYPFGLNPSKLVEKPELPSKPSSSDYTSSSRSTSSSAGVTASDGVSSGI